jgi:hypothetical protein
MHLNRLRVGEITAAVGAAMLVVSLFLDWVSVDAPDYVRDGWTAYAELEAGTSGFDAAGIVLVLLLLIVAALALTLVFLTVTVEPVGLTISFAVATAFFGIVATVATLLRVALFQPDLGAGLGDSVITMEIGAYGSLLGVLLCAAGGWLTLRDERMDAPYSAAPELEPRPAPPAEPAPR